MATFTRADGTQCRVYNWRESALGGCRNQLVNWVTQYQTMDCGRLPVLVGLRDDRNIKWVRDGVEFLYGDHAYFDRGWDKNHFRLIRNGHHLAEVLPRPDDRLKRWDVQIEPWRKGGRTIVLIPPSPYYVDIYGIPADWVEQTVAKLKQHTDRPLMVKSGKGRLRECLLEEQDAYAVVCAISVAGMEAALMGVPVFSEPRCCSYPVSSGAIEDIEHPEYPERFAWACSLAYASWGVEELESIDFRDYHYSLKEQPCA